MYLADDEAGENGDDGLLETVHDAVQDPARPLYLGRSDDLVVVENADIVPVDRVEEPADLDCVVPGGASDPGLDSGGKFDTWFIWTSRNVAAEKIGHARMSDFEGS